MTQYTIRSTRQFDAWLANLKDHRARGVIIRRIEQAENGNWGDCASVGAGISEMRVFIGPGYRIYFTRIGQIVYMLLHGSNKTDQQRAIREAKRVLADLEEQAHG